jgi:hypothetical protein
VRHRVLCSPNPRVTVLNLLVFAPGSSWTLSIVGRNPSLSARDLLQRDFFITSTRGPRRPHFCLGLKPSTTCITTGTPPFVMDASETLRGDILSTSNQHFTEVATTLRGPLTSKTWGIEILNNTLPSSNRVLLVNIMILYFFLQIGSHASRTPLSITNFGRGHASLGPLSNLQVVTQAPNCLEKEKKKAKKAKFSVQMPKFSRCHAKIRRLPKCRIGKMGQVSHPLSI